MGQGPELSLIHIFQAVKEESPVDAFLDINTGAWYYDAVKYACLLYTSVNWNTVETSRKG